MQYASSMCFHKHNNTTLFLKHGYVWFLLQKLTAKVSMYPLVLYGYMMFLFLLCKDAALRNSPESIQHCVKELEAKE